MTQTTNIPFRGGRTCICVVVSLPLLEMVLLTKGLLNTEMDIYQLGYNSGGVTASAGTHDLGGNTDWGQYFQEQIAVERWAGWTTQRRYPPSFSPHGHGWPWKCPHLSRGGRSQAVQWANHTNGLANYGPIEGPWPVVSWQQGVKRMEKYLMGFKEDLADMIDRRVSASLPEKIWNADVIPNRSIVGDPKKNTNLAAKNAIAFLGEDANKIPALASRVTSVETKLDTIIKLLAKPPTT